MFMVSIKFANDKERLRHTGWETLFILLMNDSLQSFLRFDERVSFEGKIWNTVQASHTLISSYWKLSSDVEEKLPIFLK